MVNSNDSVEIGFSKLPKESGRLRIEGLSECGEVAGLNIARYTLSKLENSSDGFPEEILPSPDLSGCAVLGSYSVHYRNYLYDKDVSLKQIIERKINLIIFDKYLIAINSASSYYCFKLKNFDYKYMDILKQETCALEYILVIPDIGAIFIFFEDAPACFIAFRSLSELEENFIARKDAIGIFLQNMDNWRITNHEKEGRWLESVASYFRSCDAN